METLIEKSLGELFTYVVNNSKDIELMIIIFLIMLVVVLVREFQNRATIKRILDIAKNLDKILDRVSQFVNTMEKEINLINVKTEYQYLIQNELQNNRKSLENLLSEKKGIISSLKKQI